MRKLTISTAGVVVALAALSATPAHARYLQTDPIGYEDQINLYAYVGNDPINGFDPSGKCQVNDVGVTVGICSENTALQGAIDQQITDPNSNVGNTESLLVASGMRVDGVAIENGDALNNSVVVIGPEIIDGVAYPGEVQIGMQESTTLGFVGDSRVETEIPFTVADAIEHEFGSHVYDQVTGTHNDYGPGVVEVSGHESPGPFGLRETRAVNRENLFRERSGSVYRRSRDNR